MPNPPTTVGAGRWKSLTAPANAAGFGLWRRLRFGTLPGATGPSNLQATAIAPLEVRLSWSYASVPPDAVHQIERSDGAGGWYRVGSSYGSNLTFTDYHRAPNTSYTYRMRSVHSGGTSAYTGSATVTTMNEDGSGEFVGPLTGWINVKTTYGAVGNGVANDTTAIQNAFNDLNLHTSGRYVLYFPAGTYNIASTITTTRPNTSDGQAIWIVGEDPTTTILKWTGSAGGDMFHWDAWYSRLGRLTFDGNNTAHLAFGYGNTFSTFQETADCIFKNCQIGLQLGGLGLAGGQAENRIVRCQFTNCSDVGVYTNDYNSLDNWLWYCRFTNCATAVFNGAGGFHAWFNYFSGSTEVDLSLFTTMAFSVCHNVSIGSNLFLDWTPAGDIAPTTIAGNRVINCGSDASILVARYGPTILLDNLIRSRAGVTTPQVRALTGFDPMSAVFDGNLFSVANASIDSHASLRRFAEEQPTTQPIDPTAPTLPGFQPKVSRTVFEVAAGANAATIQAAINNANAGAARSVVHLPPGTYNIATTLTVPANSTIQILGDAASDAGTILNWTGTAGQPLIHFIGPSKALFSNVKIALGGSIGVLVDGIDQSGAHVAMDQVNTQAVAGSTVAIGMLIDGLDQCDVTGICQQGGECATWVKVVGGTLRNAGQAAPNRIALLTGATSSSANQYDVQSGGEVIVRSVYHETSASDLTSLTLTGRGKVAVDATRYSFDINAGTPAIVLNGFQGDFLLTSGFMEPVPGSTSPQVKISITGSGSLTRALVLATGWHYGAAGNAVSEVWSHTASPAAAAYLQNSYLQNDPNPLPPQGTISNNTMQDMLNLLRRGTMRLPGTTPAGVTDLRLHRLFIVGTTGGQCLVLRS